MPGGGAPGAAAAPAPAAALTFLASVRPVLGKTGSEGSCRRTLLRPDQRAARPGAWSARVG